MTITCRIAARVASLGMPMLISRSNLPARRKAESRASGRLVAPAPLTTAQSHTAIQADLNGK